MDNIQELLNKSLGELGLADGMSTRLINILIREFTMPHLGLPGPGPGFRWQALSDGGRLEVNTRCALWVARLPLKYIAACSDGWFARHFGVGPKTMRELTELLDNVGVRMLVKQDLQWWQRGTRPVEVKVGDTYKQVHFYMDKDGELTLRNGPE